MLSTLALLSFLALAPAPQQDVAIEGCVFDTQGRPLEGAIIDPGYAPVMNQRPLEPERLDEGLMYRRMAILGERLASSETPASGCVMLQLPSGTLRISASAEHHYGAGSEIDTTSETRFVFELEAFDPRDQRVRVVDRRTQKPVEDVRVVITSLGPRGPSNEERTDAAGEVRFRGIPQGRYRLEVARRPRVEYHVEEAMLGVTPEPLTLEVEANARVLVVGRVLDLDGRPVVNARIRGARNRPRTRTDEDGRFEVRAWATPTAFLVARKEGLGNAGVALRSEHALENVIDVGDLVLRDQPWHGVTVTRTILKRQPPSSEKPHDRNP